MRVNKKVTILLICTNSDESGAPKHVESIINELHHFYNFCFVYGGQSGPMVKRLKKKKIKTIQIKELKSNIDLKSDLKSFLKLYKIVKLLKPSLIHCHSSKAGLISRFNSFITNTPCIYTCHGWSWRGLNIFKAFLAWFFEFIASFIPTSSYIFVSKATLKEGINKLGYRINNKSKVIYNGTPVKESSLVKKQKDDHINIIMVARIDISKDHKTLLKAFNLLPSKYKLSFVGKGSNSIKFIKEAELLAKDKFEDIKFIGITSNIDYFYKKSDVLVLSSFFESHPLSIIEAMSYGLGIVASNIPGINELIIHDFNGYLFSPKDEKNLSIFLQKISDIKIRQRFRENCLNMHKKVFTLKKMSQEINTQYKNIINKN